MTENVVTHSTRTTGVTSLQWLITLQALLQILDLSTTYIALQAGATEANPISRAMIEGPGWIAYGSIKVALAGAFLGLWPVARGLDGIERKITIIAMAAFAAIMLLVVINNAIIAF